MPMQVRAYSALSIPEIQLLARDQARAFEPLQHPYPPGSAQAVAWEQAYRAEQIANDTPDLV